VAEAERTAKENLAAKGYSPRQSGMCRINSIPLDMKVHDRVRDLAHYSSRFIHDTPKRMSTTELTAVTDFSCEE